MTATQSLPAKTKSGQAAVGRLFVLDLSGGRIFSVNPDGTVIGDLALRRDLARAQACVRSAHCFMEAVIDDVWKVVAAGREVAIEQRATLRLAAVDGVQRAVEAVDLVFNAAGATSIHTSSPLERCFRDIHVVPAHFVVQPPIYEAAGRVMLGMPSGMPLF